jgi:hypothetical protein
MQAMDAESRHLNRLLVHLGIFTLSPDGTKMGACCHQDQVHVSLLKLSTTDSWWKSPRQCMPASHKLHWEFSLISSIYSLTKNFSYCHFILLPINFHSSASRFTKHHSIKMLIYLVKKCYPVEMYYEPQK